ncbi:MAG: WD40 repeat domain-containing protein [Chloroflexota bacterium]
MIIWQPLGHYSGQASTLWLMEPLLGLRLLLEAWYLGTDTEKAVLAPMIQQVINQGRVAALSPETLQRYQEEATLAPPHPQGTPLYPIDLDVSHLITTTLPITKLDVYLTPSEKYVVLEYMYDTAFNAEIKYGYEIRRMADGQRLIAADDSYLVAGYNFAVSPNEEYLEVWPSYGAGGRLYSLEDGTLTQTVQEFDSLRFSPDDQYYFTYPSKQGRAVKIYQDRQLVSVKAPRWVTFELPYTGISDLSFSPNNRYFVLQSPELYSTLYYYDDQSLLLYPLVDWGPDKAGHYFLPNQSQLVVWHSDNQAYFLDIAWLTTIHTMSGSTPMIDLACIPFKPNDTVFDEGVLDSYLKGQAPLACQP